MIINVWGPSERRDSTSLEPGSIELVCRRRQRVDRIEDITARPTHISPGQLIITFLFCL